VIHPGAVDAGEETVGCEVVAGADGIGVAGSVAGDVRQRLFDFVKSPGNIERTAEQA
jgi:hypothetical protein